MTPDQAREKAWQDGDFDEFSCPWEFFSAGFDAALTHVWEECGVPRRPAVYLRWYAREWVPTWVYEMGGRYYFDDEDEAPWAVETVRHWRRLRLPPPPQNEN